MADIQHYFSSSATKSPRWVNRWDLAALILIFGIIVLMSYGAKQMSAPFQLGEPITLSLDPSNLPFYSIRTILRMGVGLFFSLLFTLTIGTWAAKSRRAEKIIIPIIDVLQSVPVLSFLSITITGFIALFPGSLLGPECAAIFAIFVAQVWNMTLGFYQTVKTVPLDLIEAADMFHLSAWQRFWRIELPFSMSSLLWNTMMSISASWFFVVVSEAISVSHQDIRLPGIGSYIALAIEQKDMHAVYYAIITMFCVILIYDQLLFRPLVQWSERFHPEVDPDQPNTQSWVLTLLHSTSLLRNLSQKLWGLGDRFVTFRFFLQRPGKSRTSLLRAHPKFFDRLQTSIVTLVVIAASYILVNFILQSLSVAEVKRVFLLGCYTSIRVMAMIVVSSIIWVPIGIWIGMRPRVSQTAQPIIQFLASFPAYLLFPLVVMPIVYFHLNPEIWVTPLMILGTQWYILFNVIAGASVLPKDIYLAAKNFHVTGWLWWTRLALPSIFPYYITGAITAAGGAWNASIVAEWAEWGNTSVRATGLGAYIQQYTMAGDFHRIALGTGVMCIFVLSFNRLIWHPLHRIAQERFRFD